MTPPTKNAPIRVRTYTGATPDEAGRAYAADAQEAAGNGYHPTSQVWNGSMLTVTYQYVKARPNRVRQLVWIVGLFFLLGGGGLISLLAGRQPGPTATSSVVPPAGVIWFGSSFDTDTLALRGRTTGTPIRGQVALVAHMFRDQSDPIVKLVHNGEELTSWNVALGGSYPAFGQVINSGVLYEAGPYTFRVMDVGGNVLAEGTLTVTP